MNPGPAISVLATSSFGGSAAVIAPASARGFARAALARRSATDQNGLLRARNSASWPMRACTVGPGRKASAHM